MSEGSAIIVRMMNARILATRLADLLRREQGAMAEFLVALSEFDRQRAWVDLGYPSLFDFLHRELGMSRGAAHYRKTAAELMQKFPEIVEPLRDGRLCITSIVQLAKVLTPENCREVLPQFFQRSKLEAMAIAAELQPATAAPHRDVLTSPAVTTSLPRDSWEPLTGKLSRLHITVSDEFLAKLQATREALSHTVPGGSTAAVLETAMDLVLKEHARRKGVVKRPRKIARPAKSDTLTAKVKREVWARDGRRCQWPLDSGGICGSTSRVEFDHSLTPRARGGPSTADNIRLLCRMHNDLAARQAFGDDWMDQFTRNPREVASARLTQGPPSG